MRFDIPGLDAKINSILSPEKILIFHHFHPFSLIIYRLSTIPGAFRNHPQLVGGLEPWNFMTFHVLGISSSQLKRTHIFRGVGIPPTS